MRIYRMRATFGKLEDQTLSFDQGLNVIHAPNEWGKSTWCAFLIAMLYGIDTRERSRQGVLADKTHYAPWSGSPMSGRIDLCWKGRDITIERATRGRTVFGEFKAYETATGLPVTELTATGCGQTLLGVERSVFTRAGFIKLTDLPVSDDDALRRRLNALVTTGDESGASDDLAQKLKALKNRCRHNRTGLLPQLEEQRGALRQTLDRLAQLRAQLDGIAREKEALETQLQLLRNHKAALAYASAQEDLQRVAQAQAALEQARQDRESQAARCAALPDRESAQAQILQLEQLQLQQQTLEREALPPMPQAPEAPAVFAGLSPEQALTQAQADKNALDNLNKPRFPVLPVLAGVCLINAVILCFVTDWLFSLIGAACAVTLLILWLCATHRRSQEKARLLDRYPGLSPDQWIETAQHYRDATAAYSREEATYQALAQRLADRKAELAENQASCTGGMTVSACLEHWRQVIAQHEKLQQTQQALTLAQRHADTLEAMAKPAVAPAGEDPLTYPAAQTETLLIQAENRLHQLQLQQGQAMGQMQTLGQEAQVQKQLDTTQERIDRLEDIYTAVTIAMDTLTEASSQLQRKFAPRISQRAQTIFSQLTAGRYDRLMLDDALAVSTAAQNEVTLRTGAWRSDGTADQQYLALRLAVAEELTPEAPLILDDALVRFDDTRLAQAMTILKAAAQDKQVILFTCQKREQEYL